MSKYLVLVTIFSCLDKSLLVEDLLVFAFSIHKLQEAPFLFIKKN